MRSIALFAAVAGLCVTQSAAACSCIPFEDKVTADRTGEKVYRSIGLIVDATVGPATPAYLAACDGDRRATTPETVSADRVLIIHRTYKGKASATAVLAGAPVTRGQEGCVTSHDSCQSHVLTGTRMTLILKPAGRGRVEMLNYCEQQALRESRRGKALFEKLRRQRGI